MASLSIAVNTQTPPVVFRATYQQLVEKYGELPDPLDLSALEEEDYRQSVGGVSRMVLQLAEIIEAKLSWVSLGVGFPPRATYRGISLRFVDLDHVNLQRYTRFKEGIYSESHGLGGYAFDPKDYIGYVVYNWSSARELLELFDEADVYFVNDFQQLLVGGIIGPSAPAVLWYHIPLIPENIDERLRTFLRKSVEGFDYVVVSTRRDLEGLVRLRARVDAKQIYPFVDVRSSPRPGRSELEAARERYGLDPRRKSVLVVGRMDPIKGQDVAIRAMRGVDAALYLVGDGSFTSGHLGHDKAGRWRARLAELAAQEGVSDKVKFLGYVPDEDLAALYELADVVLLPSRVEGFGLAVCEGWAHRKPVVVSSGAGASELVMHGLNGYVFRSGDPSSLASALEEALASKESVGELGYQTMLKQCEARAGSQALAAVFEDAMKAYGRSPRPSGNV